MVKTCKLVQKSGKSNWEGERLQLPSSFNFDFIEKHLIGFNQPKVVEFLKFGFPLGNVLGLGSRKVQKNHKGATDFNKQMTSILQTEVKENSVIGPFKKPVLLDSCYSPLNSVPKKDSSDRRLILDLSLPHGFSINNGIDKDTCLGYFHKLQLPSVDDLVSRIVQLGPGCKIFKIDLTRAYRQLFVCPGEAHFLGYFYKGQFYYDCTLSMGSKSSAKACQLVTTAVVFIYTKFGYFAVNYLDDLGSAESSEKAEEAYKRLLRLLHDFGLKPALHKCVPPCTCLIFLGIEVNTIDIR